MPKPHTFPTLYDDLKTISISFLTKHGYLKPNQWRSGTITWSREYQKTASISITVYNNPYKPYMILDYSCNGKLINYKVQLFALPSNLGKGKVWYFVCPLIGKLCRKLYLSDGYFYHRTAIKDAMYPNQAESRKNRYLCRLFEKWRAGDEAGKLINSKHFKTHYNGQPTKRYLKALNQITAGQHISLNALLMA